MKIQLCLCFLPALLIYSKPVSEQRVLSYLYKSEEVYNRNFDADQAFSAISQALHFPSHAVTKSILSYTSLLLLANNQNPAIIAKPTAYTIHKLLQSHNDLSTKQIIEAHSLLLSLVAKEYGNTCFVSGVAHVILDSFDLILQSLHSRNEGLESIARHLPLALSHISNCQIRVL
jgi:hypothetical protein